MSFHLSGGYLRICSPQTTFKHLLLSIYDDLSMIEEEKRSLRQQRKEKKLAHKLRIVEKRDRMLIKNLSSERAVMEEVFDRSTLMTIYDFMNKGKIDEIYGVVNAGKEARVYWGKDQDGRELAIKIYLTVSAEFKKGMLPYIRGDPRFAHVRKDTRSLIYAWAQKEFKNLQRAMDASVKVPEPIAVSKNVLIMSFIGKNGDSAPLLKEVSIKNSKQVYRRLLTYMKKLYQKAKLVHADLSEYNIMIWKNTPVLFDVAQAVTLEHPMADQFLRRDLQNLYKYFKKLGVDVLSVEEMHRRITGDKT